MVQTKVKPENIAASFNTDPRVAGSSELFIVESQELDRGNYIAETQKQNEELAKNIAKTDKEIIAEIKAGGNVKLLKDLYVETGVLTLVKDTVIDLGGHTLSGLGSTYGDTIEIGNGANVTLKNGTIKAADKTSAPNGSAVIIVKTSTKSTLTLDNVKMSGVYPVYLNNAAQGTEVVINSGTYTSPYDNGVAVYVQQGGKVIINGGTYGEPGHTSAYLLNLKDSLNTGHKPYDYIEVRGGEFYNFNPAASMGEPNGPVSFVPEGYTVTSVQKGNDTIYKVSKA